jgi:hypothetical protein
MKTAIPIRPTAMMPMPDGVVYQGAATAGVPDVVSPRTAPCATEPKIDASRLDDDEEFAVELPLELPPPLVLRAVPQGPLQSVVVGLAMQASHAFAKLPLLPTAGAAFGQLPTHVL